MTETLTDRKMGKPEFLCLQFFCLLRPAADNLLGASIFWLRRLAALDGEQAAIEHWQLKRNGRKRGIVEITGLWIRTEQEYRAALERIQQFQRQVEHLRSWKAIPRITDCPPADTSLNWIECNWKSANFFGQHPRNLLTPIADTSHFTLHQWSIGHRSVTQK
jgi:hypothetical protein